MSHIAEKHDRLRRRLARERSVVVAFSGGVDSTLVLAVARDVLGRDAILAAAGVSPSLAESERSVIVAVAETLDAPLEFVPTNEIDDPVYRRNGRDRCRACKRELYGKLTAIAQARGGVVCNGVIVDDTHDVRPGVAVAREMGVAMPLLESGFTKDDVRTLAKQLDLPNHAKPASPCLASRVVHGVPVTVETLARVERAEAFLRDRGFVEFRVRDHGRLARIEAPPDALPRLLEEPLRSDVVAHLKSLGYAVVSLDLEGFRSGSGNLLAR